MIDPQIKECCRMPNWFPRFSLQTLPATFVYLNDAEREALINGTRDFDGADALRRRLDRALSNYLYSRFVSIDLAAPVDTSRFASKRGAVHSAKTAWAVLTESERIRASAKNDGVTAICVRPFRRMNQAREFRLFIKNRKLKAMSQYWLIRHFPNLEKNKESYWHLASEFIESNAWNLPVDDIVMDIYFTSSNNILVIDLNPFDQQTDPLMLNTWDLPWDDVVPIGIKTVPPPRMVSGSVNVSF